MKIIAFLAALALVVGCSSNSKKEESPSEEVSKEENAQVETTEDEDQVNAAGKSEGSAEAVEKADKAEAQVETRAEGAGETGNTQATEGAGFSAVIGEVTESYECSQGQDSRKIEVTTAQGQSPLCGVAYTKFGASKTVAIANNDGNFCSKVATQIRDSLVAAGFNCNAGAKAATAAPATEPTAELQPAGEEVEEADPNQ